MTRYIEDVVRDQDEQISMGSAEAVDSFKRAILREDVCVWRWTDPWASELDLAQESYRYATSADGER
jgi:hypothetical protein